MNEYETLISAVTVLPKGEPMYSEMATTIRLEDEAGGLFVVVEQDGGHVDKKGVAIDQAEWPQIRKAIDTLMEVCVARNKESV